MAIDNDNSSENKLMKEILLEHLKERRRSRRWGIFFKLFVIFLIIFIIWQSSVDTPLDKKLKKVLKPHIAKIEIQGVISDTHPANADEIIESLNAAYSNSEVKAIILEINSPGGTPVQARRIYSAIQRGKKENPEIKVYAVIGDIGASAAYLIASAADEIYADQTSFVGSIGALVSSFGFVDAMEKVGIERRLYTAGKYKGMLDPFSKITEEEVFFIQQSLDVVHQEFIDNVKQGRGDRLKQNPDLFSGRFWTGKEAYQLGLIDGFGDINHLSIDVIKLDNIVDYTAPESIIEKIMGNLPTKIKSMALELCLLTSR